MPGAGMRCRRRWSDMPLRRYVPGSRSPRWPVLSEDTKTGGRGRRVWETWHWAAGAALQADQGDGRGRDRARAGARAADPARSPRHRGPPALPARGAPGFHPADGRRAGGVAAHRAAVGDEEARGTAPAWTCAGPGDRGGGSGAVAAPGTCPSACPGRSGRLRPSHQGAVRVRGCGRLLGRSAGAVDHPVPAGRGGP